MNKRVYRSMQGKVVDMELLTQKNELAPAVGNVRVNARGDELGAGGQIIRKREDVMAEYYENNPNAVRDEQFKRPAEPAPTSIPLTSKNVSPDVEHTTTTRRNSRREASNGNSENKTDS